MDLPVARVPGERMRVPLSAHSPAAKRLVRAALAGLGEPAFDRVRLGPKKLDVVANTADPLAQWMAALVAGAMRDRLVHAGLEGPTAWSVTAGGGGRGLPIATGSSGRRIGPVTDADRRALTRAVHDAAAASGGSLKELLLVEPLGLAPAVKLAGGDPERFLAALGPWNDRIDGAYVWVDRVPVDESTEIVVEEFLATATRLGWQRRWSADRAVCESDQIRPAPLVCPETRPR